MKFLCVPCDTPMKLQTVVPPDRGSLSVVYACPECGYEIAMLTNAYETQVVQSLGVRIGPDLGAEAAGTSGSSCPFAAMLPATDGASGGDERVPDSPSQSPSNGPRGRSQAREHPRVRAPDGTDGHRDIRPRAWGRAGGRDDPRRGPRLLRDVTRRSFSGGGRDKAPGPLT